MAEDRKSQLRLAKQRQRYREKQAGYGLYQIKLESRLLEKLKIGMQKPVFVEKLAALIDHEMLDINHYDNLKLLAWNRRKMMMTREEAWDLYESNWRFVDLADMATDERQLFEQLKQEFGQGVVNA
jgi:hypothetical protein